MGSHFATYRGKRLADGAGVIFKTTTALAGPQADARLEREYEISRSLDDPGVVRADALERVSHGHVLIFPDGGRVALDRYLEGRGLQLDSFLAIALELAEILGRIHMRGVVHKDVKPSNIVIDLGTLSVQLTDFGIAAVLARETASNRAPDELEGTLSYIAPEQTGRMNRSIDGRSDLYSLGVTFYQMLTARLPFEASDPAELVHQHIARMAQPPAEHDPSIPEPLSRVVMKLMAKDPEDRYQSGFGLAHDLKMLARSIREGAPLGGFEIGQRDVSGVLRLPERLYGREAPLRALVKAVDAAAGGRARLLRVAGPSGIGKSALVREVMRPVAGRRGYFISGKFDQLNRNVPYSAIALAFEELARKCLAESGEQVARLRGALLEALGGSAQVIIDVVSGFEQLLGKQPPVAALGPTESLFRFNLVFRRFLRLLATSDHPLVVFLDDLQWADSASLALIETLATDPEIANLLVIGAYRDNEIHAGHPVLALFADLQRAGVPIDAIQLPPLQDNSVGELVANALRVSVEYGGLLARLVTAKTRGNPFFVRQFLGTLHDRGLLVFDPPEGRWRWDVATITNEQITDNVVELVAARITSLDAQAQRLVQLAACIGNRFDLETLSIVSGTSPREAAAGLAGALRHEIVVPIGEAYKYLGAAGSAVAYRFAHDRLQLAAYSTIPEGERAELHERIGRLILSRSSETQIEERLFEIVNHLDLAIERIEGVDRKKELAQLNLRAGQKAKGATAYQAALRYLAVGADLLGEAGWSTEPGLSFELNLNRAEASFLSGRFAEAQALAERLLERADATLDKVRVLELLILDHTIKLEYPKAIEEAVRALALLGQPLPARPGKLQLLVELARTRLALGGKTIEDLKSLPRMKDPYKLAAMRVMMLATPPAYFHDPNLMPLLALRMVRLSVKHGNADHSPYGYVMYGVVLCGVLGDMPRGLAFGKLALDLLERFDAQDIKGKVIMVFGSFIQHWNGKLAETLPLYLRGAAAALDAGDLEFHGYNRYAHLSYAFMGGAPLDRVAELLEQHHAAVLEHKHEKTDRIMRMARESIRELRGALAGPRRAGELEFDEAANLTLWAERDKVALAYFHKYRMVRRFMAHDFAGALESARFLDANFSVVMGMAYSAYYQPFESLALIATLPSMSGPERRKALRRVRANQRRMRRWSRWAPENYLHKWVMVEAELERLRGRAAGAERGYEEAVRLAHRHGALHDEAIAHELAGAFQLGRGYQTSGRAHLREARRAYQRWGAFGWVDHLVKRHPAIFGQAPRSAGGATAMDSSESRGLVDVASISKAARAISGKIVLEEILEEVMRATMVSAGADRGLLLLAQGSELQIVAEAAGKEGLTTLHVVPLSESKEAPLSLINYAARAQRSVVLEDAPSDASYGDDPYIAGRKPLSVLCAPLLDKGKLIGLLYLENSLARGAFTPARIQTLEMLAALATTSLENARLYRQVSQHAGALEVKVKERTQELEDAYGRLREIFGKYVPRRVAEAMVAGRGSLKPTQTTATILFSDIESFTTIAEQMPPERVVQMLNEYFSAMIAPVDRNGGIVNQFQGDAMLVTFNVPIADPRHADRAVRTAMEMQEAMKGRTFAGVSLRTRIGIHTGEVIAGNVGSGDRVNYTVHGDAVNLAARIEQLNKEYGSLVLLSGTTAALLEGGPALEPAGEVIVRGKTTPVRLFKLSG